MGLLDKVKNFFYDEEDVEDEYEEETHKEVKKENKRKYEPVKEDIVRKRENRLEKENEEVTERELFKAESTFNFPMDLDDTIYEKPSKTVSRLEKVQKEEPKKETGDSSFEKKMLRSVIIAVSHIIYLNDCFKNNLQDNASDFIRRAK